MRGEEVIDKLKHTSHHFVELMLKCYWKFTSQKDERFDCQFFYYLLLLLDGEAGVLSEP